MILLELRQKKVNGKLSFVVRASFNKVLLDLSGLCPIQNGDIYQCPYEIFKNAIEGEIVLPESAKEYCGTGQIPQEQSFHHQSQPTGFESLGAHETELTRRRRNLEEFNNYQFDENDYMASNEVYDLEYLIDHGSQDLASPFGTEQPSPGSSISPNSESPAETIETFNEPTLAVPNPPQPIGYIETTDPAQDEPLKESK